MAYFRDLTRCTYGGLPHRAAGELAVGWLSVAYPFPTGNFPSDLLDRLAELVENPVNRFRGMHDCDICLPAVEHRFPEPPEEHQGVLMQSLGTWIVSERTDWSVRIAGREIDVGNGEIQVVGEGNVVYVAPTMILHYIVAHRYLPPEEFLRAVRTGHLPELPPEAFVV